MTLDQLREVHRARPFVPFKLQLADGSQVRVPHPEFLWLHPRGGRIVFVAGPRETVKIIDLFLVSCIEVGNAKGNGRRKK